jgi:hypothetical protein
MDVTRDDSYLIQIGHAAGNPHGLLHIKAGRVNIGESTKGCNRNLTTLSHLNGLWKKVIKLNGDRLIAF